MIVTGVNEVIMGRLLMLPHPMLKTKMLAIKSRKSLTPSHKPYRRKM
jgi:hypothetical protein